MTHNENCPGVRALGNQGNKAEPNKNAPGVGDKTRMEPRTDPRNFSQDAAKIKKEEEKMRTEKESPAQRTRGNQKAITEHSLEQNKPYGAIVRKQASSHNAARFLTLLETHVSGLVVRGYKATGLCPLHDDRHPSFTADLDKGVWYCWPCARGGGVKDFALAVGERWEQKHHNTRDRARFAVLARRREAEVKARAILTRRKDTRDATLWSAWSEATTAALSAAEVLGLFFRRPDLAEEFPLLVEVTEREYSSAIWQKMLTAQRVAGEVTL